jgi:hypothetical protein
MAMQAKFRKHSRSGDDFRAVVGRPGPAPTGRALLDDLNEKDVSYRPTERELKLIKRLSDLKIDSVSRAEAECIIRRTLTRFANAPLNDRRMIADEAKKFDIAINTA